MKNNAMTLAIKCPPEESILSQACEAGLKAAELHISKALSDDLESAARICGNFPIRYAIHASNDDYPVEDLARFAEKIRAEVIVFHNIYWEDEWPGIIDVFKGIKTKLCVENVQSVLEPLKFMRRYGLRRCLDLEHLQIECAGIYYEELHKVIKEADHIHLTGYVYGSQLWHTHIHYSPRQSLRVLDLIKESGYSGFIVSEAKASLQTYDEFKKLNSFYEEWKNRFTDGLIQEPL